MEQTSFFRWKGEDLWLQIQVQPRASRTQWVGLHNGALKLRLTAAPVDDQANRQCINFISKFFRTSKQSISIVKGQTGRKKTIQIKKINPELWASFLRGL